MKRSILQITLAAALGIITFEAQSQPSYNCARARLASEITICQSSELSTLDRQMSNNYFSVRARLGGRNKHLLRAQQKAWLRSRNACRHNFGCLQNSYYQRINELANW